MLIVDLTDAAKKTQLEQQEDLFLLLLCTAAAAAEKQRFRWATWIYWLLVEAQAALPVFA